MFNQRLSRVRHRTQELHWLAGEQFVLTICGRNIREVITRKWGGVECAICAKIYRKRFPELKLVVNN